MQPQNDGIPRIIERGPPNRVIYDLTEANRVRITLGRGSTWTSGLHWHENHVEYLKVAQGRVKVRLGDGVQVLHGSPENQPEIKVERHVWHEWQRAQPDDGEDVVVIERTEPADGDKSLFFWNLNGVLLDAPTWLQDKTYWISHVPVPALQTGLLELWITLHLFVIFHHLDNMPVLVDFPGMAAGNSIMLQRILKSADWAATHAVLYLAALLGKMLGVPPLRLKYTPAQEYAEWMARTS